MKKISIEKTKRKQIVSKYEYEYQGCLIYAFTMFKVEQLPSAKSLIEKPSNLNLKFEYISLFLLILKRWIIYICVVFSYLYFAVEKVSTLVLLSKIL